MYCQHVSVGETVLNGARARMRTPWGQVPNPTFQEASDPPRAVERFSARAAMGFLYMGFSIKLALAIIFDQWNVLFLPVFILRENIATVVDPTENLVKMDTTKIFSWYHCKFS